MEILNFLLFIQTRFSEQKGSCSLDRVSDVPFKGPLLNSALLALPATSIMLKSAFLTQQVAFRTTKTLSLVPTVNVSILRIPSPAKSTPTILNPEKK